MRHAGERLDVVDHGRRAVEALDRRERRPQPRLAAIPLERLEERRLLAADVRAGAPVHHHVQRIVAPRDLRAQVTALVRLRDRALEHRARPDELAAAVHERGPAVDRVGADDQALQELVRIATADSGRSRDQIGMQPGAADRCRHRQNRGVLDPRLSAQGIFDILRPDIHPVGQDDINDVDFGIVLDGVVILIVVYILNPSS